MEEDQGPQNKKIRTEESDVTDSVLVENDKDNGIQLDPEVSTPKDAGDNRELTPTFKMSQPRKLVLGSPEHRFAFSQPTVMPSSEKLPSGQVPSLQETPLPPLSQASGLEERGRKMRTYTQSPPKSPNRSPTRKLELIKLSPTKKSRMELQKLYDAKQAEISKKERLFIHQLVLNNFKSYAGCQVIGPFHASFSAVVGPNGSGKSNVIDSMLFVFGFRANKMRQDRLSELIHKSEEFPDLKSCSVEVHFKYAVDKDNDEEVPEILPEKELIVERRAFKNNSSKYYINGKESNYTEVTKLLKQEGIDLDHKRFLILQGEVENIAQMKPKAEKESDDGLLEYLEDIIGTANYKPLIEENSLKVDDLNEICIEKKTRFDYVSKEKLALEDDKDKALDFVSKEKELTIAKATLTQFEIYQNNKKIQSTLTKLSSLSSELEEKTNNNLEFLKSRKTIEQKIDTLKHKMDKLEKEIKILTKQKRDITSSKVANEELHKNMSRKKKITENTIEKTEGSVRETENQLKDLEKIQLEYQTELDDLYQQLELEKTALDDIKVSLKDKTEDISKEINKLEKDLEPWNIEIQKKKTNIKLTEMDINLINENKDKLKTHINASKDILANLKDSLSQREARIKDLEQRHQNISNELKVGETECNNAKTKLQEMSSAINLHRQQALDARANLSNVVNRSRILVELNKLQKAGTISGFHGRLGDLGVIDDKYDVAVSTACPRLNDIVVETVECGQYCLEFIKKNKLGFTRFILLDKINSNISNLTTPEATPRLFDLVTPKDSKFRAAFFNVMGNTLVANDLRQANRVAYGKRRFRVVTLDGKLIDISGTITGGGNSLSSNLLQLKSKASHQESTFTEEEVSRMEATLAEKEKGYDIARETYMEMESELEKLKESGPQVEMEVTKLKIDIESIENDIKIKEADLQRQIEEEGADATDVVQLTELNNKLKSLKEDLKDTTSQCKNISDKITDLKEEIMKTGGTKLQIQNSKVNSISERIRILEMKSKKDKNTIKKSESALVRLKNTIEKLGPELVQFEDDIRKAQAVITEADLKINDVETKLNNSESEIFDLKTELEGHSEKLQEVEDELNNFKTFELDIKNKIEKLCNLNNVLRKSADRLGTELSSYKLRDLPIVTELLTNLTSTSETSTQTVLENETPQNSQKETTEDNITDSDEGMSSDEKDNPQESGKISSSNSEEIESQEERGAESMDVDEEDKEVSKGIPRISERELENLDVLAYEQHVEELQNYINSATINIDVLDEYARRLEEHKKRESDLKESLENRDQITQKLEELKKKRFNEFMEGFGIISMTLKEMYQMITMGGNAELELVDSLDPFSEGVTFSVMPPKKSWRNITNLSGGEKTLSSLALVFALHKYKPTPLYVMDEIDAALDFRNVSIVANYITERTKNAQFIVISLRNNMFELAKNLVGIYKYENMSKSATIKNKGTTNI